MNKVTAYFFYLFLGVLFLSSCKKEDIMSFQAKPAVNFVGQTTEYSFMSNPENEYVQEVDVRILGDTVDYDRHFSAEVVKDSLTTARDDQFEIIGGVVKAGEFTGKLSVKLRNAPELSTTKIAVKLKLTDSEDFKAGNIELSTFVVTWSNQVVVPSWTYFRYYFTAVASTSAYRAIVVSTGLTRLTAADFRVMQAAGAEALGTKFGDYVMQWNKDHPNDHLKHDDGTRAGQDIVPLYYTHSKFD